MTPRKPPPRKSRTPKKRDADKKSVIEPTPQEVVEEIEEQGEPGHGNFA